MPDSCPLVPVSWGELLDKISILEIKNARIAGEAALANVRRELALLNAKAAAVLGDPAILPLRERLRVVNEALWEIEDEIRLKEADGDFGDGFVRLARSVYRRNDERAAIKRAINERLDSALVEEKSYAARGLFFPAGAEPARSGAGG